MSKALTQVQAIKQDIANMSPQFKSALPNHISVDKFVRTVQTAIATSPQLVQANKQSLFAAAMRSAQDGLLPDGKEAAIVTFNSKSGVTAQYMPMVGGILKKIRNSGELSSITAQIIYEHDEFDFYVDEKGEHIKHRPNLFSNRGKKIAAYALATTKDGAVYVEIMSMEQIEAVKSVSRGKNGPWSGPFADEMIKKTVIKRLSKRLPMSTDLEFTMKADDDLYDLNQPEDTPEPVEKDVTAPQRLSKILAEDEPKEVVETSADPEPDELADNEVPI